MEYSGADFRTQESQKDLKRDDSHIRFDYKMAGAQGAITKGFAEIKRVFVHTAYPDGPERFIVEGDWFRLMGKCNIAKTDLVRIDPNHPFNHSSKFVFLDSCYQRPVAVWPYDPLNKLPVTHPKKAWFDIIDRNQSEYLEK